MPNHAEMEAPPSVLVASRDNDYSGTLLSFLEQSGYGTERCHDTKGVLREIGLRDYQVLVLDLDIMVYESEESSDTDLISFVCRQSPNTRIIIVFDMNDIERAIEGIRHGAYFYVPKGSQSSDVVLVVDKAIQDLKLRATVMEHEQHLLAAGGGHTNAGRSASRRGARGRGRGCASQCGAPHADLVLARLAGVPGGDRNPHTYGGQTGLRSPQLVHSRASPPPPVFHSLGVA